MLFKEQFQMLLQRNRIENLWSAMKLTYNLIYHCARSATEMFRHFFYSISVFLLHLVGDIRPRFLVYSKTRHSTYLKSASFFLKTS